MKVVSCKIPSKTEAPLLNEKVTKFQMHKHNSYCMRVKKCSNGSRRVCRFGFPRSVTKEFVLRNVQTAIAGRRNLRSKSRLYDLPRTEDEEYINDYVPIILFHSLNLFQIADTYLRNGEKF